MKILSIVGGLILLLGTFFGVIKYLDRYALCEDVKKVEQKTDKVEKRLDLKILNDRYEIKRQRIDVIKDRFQGKKMDTTNEETVKLLEIEKVELEKEMKQIEKK